MMTSTAACGSCGDYSPMRDAYRLPQTVHVKPNPGGGWGGGGWRVAMFCLPLLYMLHSLVSEQVPCGAVPRNCLQGTSLYPTLLQLGLYFWPFSAECRMLLCRRLAGGLVTRQRRGARPETAFIWMEFHGGSGRICAKESFRATKEMRRLQHHLVTHCGETSDASGKEDIPDDQRLLAAAGGCQNPGLLEDCLWCAPATTTAALARLPGFTHKAAGQWLIDAGGVFTVSPFPPN